MADCNYSPFDPCHLFHNAINPSDSYPIFGHIHGLHQCVFLVSVLLWTIVFFLLNIIMSSEYKILVLLLYLSLLSFSVLFGLKFLCLLFCAQKCTPYFYVSTFTELNFLLNVLAQSHWFDIMDKL